VAPSRGQRGLTESASGLSSRRPTLGVLEILEPRTCPAIDVPSIACRFVY
jgi:hypothetical protein